MEVRRTGNDDCICVQAFHIDCPCGTTPPANALMAQGISDNPVDVFYHQRLRDFTLALEIEIEIVGNDQVICAAVLRCPSYW